jgi:hypothetical protein
MKFQRRCRKLVQDPICIGLSALEFCRLIREPPLRVNVITGVWPGTTFCLKKQYDAFVRKGCS